MFLLLYFAKCLSVAQALHFYVVAIMYIVVIMSLKPYSLSWCRSQMWFVIISSYFLVSTEMVDNMATQKPTKPTTHNDARGSPRDDGGVRRHGRQGRVACKESKGSLPWRSRWLPWINIGGDWPWSGGKSHFAEDIRHGLNSYVTRADSSTTVCHRQSELFA